MVNLEHDDGDCHGTRCYYCQCCMHSEYCGIGRCRDNDCGCSFIAIYRTEV